jgi:mRNA export factor
MDPDLLDSLLELEEKFYQEGYDLGLSDGARAGYTEGSVFAVEQGFEKLLELGRLYGKALVWNQRLLDSSESSAGTTQQAETSGLRINPAENLSRPSSDEVPISPVLSQRMPGLPEGSRLAKNIQTLLGLLDPATLSLENTEDAVSDIEERLKGASLKAKLIQRALGEPEHISADSRGQRGKSMQPQGDGSGSIEDISSLSIRH